MKTYHKVFPVEMKNVKKKEALAIIERSPKINERELSAQNTKCYEERETKEENAQM